ncbi:MAG: excisionase family DNA-binding protein [Acidobacteria bacterium]|nr:excisionase family DNA-binding protein [Acidobacteriota bacterium]
MDLSARASKSPECVHTARDFLTTGQAAALCAVNPDTVLKWIKRGKLKATRTAGGHFRIERSDLERLLAVIDGLAETDLIDIGAHQPVRRCWEFFTRDGVLSEPCADCVVYKVRASWCFQVGTPGCELGQAKHTCGVPCNQCLYFLRVAGKRPKVLIISSDESMITRLASQESDAIQIGFARNGYEASAILCSYRPTFVVADEDLLNTTEAGLLDHLSCDSRVRGIQLGVAVADASSARTKTGCLRSASYLVRKPIAVRALESLLSRIPVESLPAPEAERQPASRHEGCR